MAELFKTQFFAVLKQAMGRTVKKYWLTGVLPVFRDGISPLTATTVISGLPMYNDLCGLTEDDVHTITKAYLGKTPQLDARLHEMKRWFGGYRFCRQDSGDDRRILYNPHQVFRHLEFATDHTLIHGESNATHSSTVLEALGNVNLLTDFFMAAHGNTLSPVIHSEFGPREMTLQVNDKRKPSDWIPSNLNKTVRTLLYYFGVLSYHPKDDILYIPNATMRRFVSPAKPLKSFFSAFVSHSLDAAYEITWRYNQETQIQWT